VAGIFFGECPTVVRRKNGGGTPVLQEDGCCGGGSSDPLPLSPAAIKNPV
jgi:hypothetical protein